MNIYEFMHNLQLDGQAVGVDACTVTSTGLAGKISINLILDGLREVLDVEKKVPFKFQGASGWAAGSVRYAAKWSEVQRQQWAILMVTGKQSWRTLTQAAIYGDVKFTRVDLYCDVMLRERVFELARKLFHSYKGNVKTKLIATTTGDTLYVGSRESESMLRIYDKSPEYNEELGKVWRFEVEYKGDIAGLVAKDVAYTGEPIIEQFVWGEARSKDIPTPKIEARPDIRGRMVTLSSAEMKLNWLSRQVSPTIRHLQSLGLHNEVVSALQLQLPVDNS